LPESDALAVKLRAITAKLDEARKLVVATTEGGAITGEERIREHLDILYGAINGWEGRPARYQLDALDALRRELADADKTVSAIGTKDARALDHELEQHKLAPLPPISQLAPRSPLDKLAFDCVESRGEACGPDGDRAARGERD
ncbi:MAG TPA: hypothetical protein VF403_25560, partial [Kofleriaceae bacterium]